MDRTARLELEAELATLLRETERVRLAGGDRSQISALAERSSHGVFVVRRTGEIVIANRAADRLWAGRRRSNGTDGVGRYFIIEEARPSTLACWAFEHGSPCGANRASSPEPEIEEALIERRDGSRAVVLGGCGIIGEGEEALAVCAFGMSSAATDAAASTQAAHHRVSFLVQATTKLLSSSLEPEAMLAQLANLIVPVLADGCVIYLVEEAGTPRRVADVWANPATRAMVEELRRHARSDVTRWLRRVVRTGVAELYSTVPASMLSRLARDAEHRELLRRHAARSMIFAPMRSRHRVVGAIAIFSMDPERAYEAADLDMVEQLADSAALAVENAYLYEAQQRARSEMELLYELLDAVNRAATLDDVCAPALEVVERATGVARSSILLLDEGGVMRFKASHGISKEYRGAVEGHSPWPADVKDPEPVLVPDIETDPSVESLRDTLRREHIRGLAFIPLISRGKLVGKFMVYSDAPLELTPAQVRLAQTIAAQVAQAVVRKRQDAEVEAARAAAEHANQMKDEFLAVVSHELRTPLSAIVGWSAILQTDRRNEPATLAKGLAVIERNARAQATIIDDILDMARIIRGKLVLRAHPVALVPIVVETIESLKTSAAAKQIEVGLDIDCDECVLVGDPERLRQITWNLLSNAVKFTPPGGEVHVRLRRELGAIVLEVEDTGSGIAPAVLPYVFDRFRQADSSPTRRAGGLGLGLSIVRQLVELHGGQVTARSAGPGKGSTFTVTFPVRAVANVPTPAHDAEPVHAAPSNGAERPPDLGGARVLVVDDEADAREMLLEALASFGAVVEVAGSAGEALGVLARFHPAVMVLDIGMPDEDGYSLLRRVRALPAPAGRVPAVAMTAYARQEDVECARQAGFQEHVAKPAQPEVIARAVARAIGPRTGRLLGASP